VVVWVVGFGEAVEGFLDLGGGRLGVEFEGLIVRRVVLAGAGRVGREAESAGGVKWAGRRGESKSRWVNITRESDVGGGTERE